MPGAHPEATVWSVTKGDVLIELGSALVTIIARIFPDEETVGNVLGPWSRDALRCLGQQALRSAGHTISEEAGPLSQHLGAHVDHGPWVSEKRAPGPTVRSLNAWPGMGRMSPNPGCVRPVLGGGFDKIKTSLGRRT